MATALITKKEAARLLRISERTIDRLRATGQLKAVRVRGAIRFTPAEIDRFITKATVKTGH